MTSVIEATVLSGMCCGCGVCVSICPEENLKIIRTNYGEYNPTKILSCKHDCGLCCTVCPSLTSEKTDENSLGMELFQNLKNISHTSETGWYINCWVGGVSNCIRRSECASGGLASWFLAMLLRDSIVDYVVCVHASSEMNTLFEYFIAQTEIEVLASKGSAYYPNELSKVLSQLSNLGYIR